jgi:peptidyl-tRNA hydrolase, PTH1 family
VKVIVGLGNPGREYRETRHNVGFMVADELARRHHLQWAMAPGQVPETFVAKRFGEPSWLVAKPLTYMNRSGEAVAALARYYGIEAADLLIVVDEVALPFMRLRARARGSAGGHNGLKSVIAGLGSTEFPRLRLGVGAETRGETSPITCSRSSRKASRPISRRSSPGRRMPLRCLPWQTSRR